MIPRMRPHVPRMTALPRMVLPLLLAATLPAAAALAQTQSQAQPPQTGAKLSADAIGRLQDGRFAMIKESLKLNDAQLELFSAVEAQMRSAAAARRQMREERIRREQGAAARPSLPDRLDLASQRMAQRAQQLKALAEVFKAFYASLSEEQKAVADVVFHGVNGRHGRWAMRRAASTPQPH
jgi:protein CpxP